MQKNREQQEMQKHREQQEMQQNREQHHGFRRRKLAATDRVVVRPVLHGQALLDAVVRHQRSALPQDERVVVIHVHNQVRNCERTLHCPEEH